MRCATYTLGRWFGKPLAVGPMECARHGWLSDAADMLRCESCAARLCVKVPDALSIEDVQTLVCTLHARLEREKPSGGSPDPSKPSRPRGLLWGNASGVGAQGNSAAANRASLDHV